MSTSSIITNMILGLAAGLVLAALHAWAARRAAAAAVERRSATRLLIGLPLRVGGPAAAMFGLALVSLWALAGAMLSFVVGSRLLLAREAADPSPAKTR